MLRALISLCLSCAVLFAQAGDSLAIERCKAKVDRKTGVISVDVSGAGGSVLWGETVGAESNVFFNEAQCDLGETWKRCQLADPSSLAAKTPPPACTLYLDDGVAPCSIWISGCTPGPRNLVVDLAQVASDIDQIQIDVAQLVAAGLAQDAAISSLASSLATVQSNIAALQSNVAGNSSDIVSLQSDVNVNTSDIQTNSASITTLNATVSGQGSSITTLSSTVSGQASSLTTLNDKTQCLTSTSTDAYITGCNLHVLSGSGATDAAVNGLGNVIIGYNENLANSRVGSHNLVVGRWHSWTKHSGIVSGERNTIAAAMASVVGGTNSAANGVASSVLGGYLNTANGDFSSIAGGASNLTGSSFATVTGGSGNTANGAYSSVSGGDARTASGNRDWVAGALFQDN